VLIRALNVAQRRRLSGAIGPWTSVPRKKQLAGVQSVLQPARDRRDRWLRELAIEGSRREV